MGAPKISDAMVSAGVRVLHASGALWLESSADSLLVREVLDAALSAQAKTRGNSLMPDGDKRNLACKKPHRASKAHRRAAS